MGADPQADNDGSPMVAKTTTISTLTFCTMVQLRKMNLHARGQSRQEEGLCR